MTYPMDEYTASRIIGPRPLVCRCPRDRLRPSADQYLRANALLCVALSAPHEHPYGPTHDRSEAYRRIACAVLAAGSPPGADLDAAVSLAVRAFGTDVDRPNPRDQATRAAIREVEPLVHAGTLVVAGRLAGLAVADRVAAASEGDVELTGLAHQIVGLLGRTVPVTGESLRLGHAWRGRATSLGLERERGVHELACAVAPPAGSTAVALSALVRRELGASGPVTLELGRARRALVGV